MNTDFINAYELMRELVIRGQAATDRAANASDEQYFHRCVAEAEKLYPQAATVAAIAQAEALASIAESLATIAAAMEAADGRDALAESVALWKAS